MRIDFLYILINFINYINRTRKSYWDNRLITLIVYFFYNFLKNLSLYKSKIDKIQQEIQDNNNKSDKKVFFLQIIKQKEKLGFSLY